MVSCDRCKKNVTRNSCKLTCKLCSQVFHAACVGLSRYDKVDNNWSCLVCNEALFPFNQIYDDNEFIGTVRDQPIIADEIYAGMIFPGRNFCSFAEVTSKVPTIICGGLAKRFLVPGWRIGW